MIVFPLPPQYLTDGHWQTVHQLNWETSEYSIRPIFWVRLGQTLDFKALKLPNEWSVLPRSLLTTTLDGGTGTYSLVFETEESGQTNYSFSAGGSTAWQCDPHHRSTVRRSWISPNSCILNQIPNYRRGKFPLYQILLQTSNLRSIGRITSTGTDTAEYTSTHVIGGYRIIQVKIHHSQFRNFGGNSTEGILLVGVNDQIIISSTTYLRQMLMDDSLDSGSIDSFINLSKAEHTAVLKFYESENGQLMFTNKYGIGHLYD